MLVKIHEILSKFGWKYNLTNWTDLIIQSEQTEINFQLAFRINRSHNEIKVSPFLSIFGRNADCLYAAGTLAQISHSLDYEIYIDISYIYCQDISSKSSNIRP